MAAERNGLIAKAKRHNEAVGRLNSKAGQTMSKNARRDVQKGILTQYGAKEIPVPPEQTVGAPIDEIRGQHATTRLKIWETQALTVPGVPVVLTTRSGSIEEQKQRDTGLSLKKGTISLDGFTNPDIVSVASDTSFSGLCLEQPCLRLSLFLEIKTWAFGWECIPQYAMTLLDPNVIGEKVDLTPRINCSPIPGEECGGQARPEYPFGGGNGSLRIHTSLLSVSEDRRACAIYLPNTILDSIQDASRVVAIMLVALTEWPFCLYGYDVVSRPKAGREGGRGTETYTNHNISAASLVHVPGLRNIDLILPAIVSDGSTGGQANARPRWTVRAGPAGTARLAPFEQLQYCYARPNQDHSVPLTDFLVSWAAELTHDDVYRVIAKLGGTFPMMAPMAAMRDVMVLSCYVYPKLTLGSQNENPEPYQTNDEGEFDTKVLLDYTSAACVSPAVVKGDFPLQDSYQGHLLVQAFDYTAFNQVMLGLAAPEIGDQKRFAQISPEICHRGVILSNIGRSVIYSLPWNLALQYIGATSKTWLTHRQTMVSRWIPHMLQLWYGSMSMAADESLAPAGYVYSNLLSMALDVRPTTIHWTFDTGAKRPVSVYDRVLFTGDMATVYDVDGVEYDGYVPVTLVDGWIQNIAYVLPRGWVPFAPPSRLGAPLAITNKEFTGGRRLANLEETIDGELHNSPMLLPPFDLYYETGRVPRRIDVERWNTRLFMTDTVTPPKITDKNGVLIPGTSAEGKLPCARVNFVKHGEQYPPEQLAQATMCFPTVDDKGRMVFVMLPKHRADSISCSAVGSGYVNRAIFLRIWSMPSLPNPSSEVVDDELAAKILQVNLGFRIVKSADVGSTTGSAPPVPPSAEQASLDASTPQ
nr:MAG: putative capsid protein [Kustavi toti-like virus]